MNMRDLGWLTQLFERHGLSADGITIKGKESTTLSFTAPRADYTVIAEMCEEHNLTFHTSADEFIARHLDRYQVHLPEES